MAIILVTPTYRPDFDRFCFQRESMERCGIELPHLAIVDTESVGKFREIPFRRNLTIVPSREVLGDAMDRRRRVWGISRKDYRYWITGKGVHGWAAQQLMKLAAAKIVGTEVMVCLDSDTFFVDRVTEADFLSDDGRVHLYETTNDLDVEMAEWYAHSLRFFGIKEAGVPLRRFTHSPVPMHCGVVRDMLAEIERRHGMSWMEAMIRGDRIMEYTTYGVYARHVDDCRRVCPVKPELTLYYWWKGDGDPAMDLEKRLASSGEKLVLVNSNTNRTVAEYADRVRIFWDRKVCVHPEEAATAAVTASLEGISQL